MEYVGIASLGYLLFNFCRSMKFDCKTRGKVISIIDVGKFTEIMVDFHTKDGKLVEGRRIYCNVPYWPKIGDVIDIKYNSKNLDEVQLAINFDT